MTAIKNAIHKCSAILYKICGVITAFLFVALCAIIVYSVISRSIFNAPVKWQMELTQVGLCWATFLGMPMVFHKEENLRLTFVTNKLKPATWRIYMSVIDVLLIAFLVMGIIHSINLVQTTWPQMYQTIPVRRGIYYLCFPIGCVISIIHLLDNILQRKAEDAPIIQIEADKEAEAKLREVTA